jgi:hypothetical protein
LSLVSGHLWNSIWNPLFQYVRGTLFALKAGVEEVEALHDRLNDEEAASAAEQAPVPLT